MTLQVSLTDHTRSVSAKFSVHPGEILALVGSNGAGKSTILNTVVGAHRPDASKVTLAGRVLQDSSQKTWLPTHERNITLLRQDSALFPHLNVLENVCFPLRAQGVSRTKARQAGGAVLEKLGLSEFSDRKPATLSGGQSQRVALARALASNAEVLLLDEPFSALDAGVAWQVRTLLREHVERQHVIIVTHEFSDLVALADRVVALENGQVADSGEMLPVLQSAKTAHLRDVANGRHVDGVAVTGGIRLFVGRELTTLPHDLEVGTPCFARFLAAGFQVFPLALEAKC